MQILVKGRIFVLVCFFCEADFRVAIGVLFV